MKPVTLKIESGYESRTVSLDDELSVGRSDAADIQLADEGLSRVNTSFFRDGDEALVVDEGSTNGTFINGSRVGGSPQVLLDGDVLTLGSYTKINVSFKAAADAGPVDPEVKDRAKTTSDPTVRKHTSDIAANPAETEESAPVILWIAAGSMAFILILGIVGVLTAYMMDTSPQGTETVTSTESTDKPIPVRVIDALGKQKPEDIADLVQYWEVQEKEVTAEDLDIKSESSDGSDEAEYFDVTIEEWKAQREKAIGGQVGAGIWPAGLQVPAILRGDGVVKQTAKIREMQNAGYTIPMDFADLALRRNQKLLVELPMATEYWVLEVGGSSTTEPFTSFNFEADKNHPIAQVGSPDYNILSQLANNFSGEKYDMNNPAHRRQMKIRLLRMFNPRAKDALIELAKHFHAKFNRPLRVTSLSRSMQYQMELNKINANSYRGGPGRLPPHTSGCAFDLARKHMTVEQQNYLMAKLEEMEKRGTLDALIEGNINACFHVFVYEDGKPPAGY